MKTNEFQQSNGSFRQGSYMHHAVAVVKTAAVFVSEGATEHWKILGKFREQQKVILDAHNEHLHNYHLDSNETREYLTARALMGTTAAMLTLSSEGWNPPDSIMYVAKYPLN